MSLYSIATEYERFLIMLEEGDIPEEAISDTLESIEGELSEKVDNIISVIKNMRAEAEAIKAEVKELTERARLKQKKAESLLNYINETLARIGMSRYESARHKVSYRKSQALEVADEDALIDFLATNGYDDLLKYEKPSINKTELKLAIDRGVSFPGAEIKKKLNIQIK